MCALGRKAPGFETPQATANFRYSTSHFDVAFRVFVIRDANCRKFIIKIIIQLHITSASIELQHDNDDYDNETSDDGARATQILGREKNRLEIVGTIVERWEKKVSTVLGQGSMCSYRLSARRDIGIARSQSV